MKLNKAQQALRDGASGKLYMIHKLHGRRDPGAPWEESVPLRKAQLYPRKLMGFEKDDGKIYAMWEVQDPRPDYGNCVSYAPAGDIAYNEDFSEITLTSSHGQLVYREIQLPASVEQVELTAAHNAIDQ